MPVTKPWSEASVSEWPPSRRVGSPHSARWFYNLYVVRLRHPQPKRPRAPAAMSARVEGSGMGVSRKA